MKKHLTQECFTIMLLKKQMDAQDWPRLQKAEVVLSYIRMDFKQWTWESDTQSDDLDIMSARADIHSLGMNNGQQVMILLTRSKV